MRNLYSNDISKFTETKGCPANSSKPYVNQNTNAINMNSWSDDDPNSYNDFSKNLVPCSDSFFNNPDNEGCCYSEYSYDEDKSMGLKLDFSGVMYNIFNKYDVQNIYKNNMLDDPNKLMKFFKLVFASILTLIITAVIGSCYEFWLRYGNFNECFHYINDCENAKNTISLVDYVFPNTLFSYPYQECNADKNVSSLQKGGADIRKNSNFINSNGKNCYGRSIEIESKYDKPFPYNLPDMAIDNISTEIFRIPIKAFSFFFLVTMLMMRKVLNPLFKRMSKFYQNNIAENSILNNLVFLFLSGIIFTIIGYYINNSLLSSGPSLLLMLVCGIISFITSFGIIGGLLFTLLPSIFLPKNVDYQNYYQSFDIIKILRPLRDNEGKWLSWKKRIINFILNVFLIIPIVIPILFIIYLLSGILGSIFALLYANIIVPLKILLIPMFNGLEFFDIIKSHADLLTILFCAGVIGSSSESLDKTTTGIMSLILVIIIIAKIFANINK